MAATNGISLEFSDNRTVPVTLEGIQAALRTIGAGVWPLDLGNQPEEVRALLAEVGLEADACARLKAAFLLPRERLLQVIADAGRAPAVPGGGALSTYVTNQGYGYPQLYQVEEGIDYSRFDRFHVNVADDGAGVDEVFQMLWGSGFVIHERLDDGQALTLKLSCPRAGQGWLGTYSGTRPHIGSVSSAAVGSKFLVQVIGAPRWSLQYVDAE